jgi:hypothetical protein
LQAVEGGQFFGGGAVEGFARPVPLGLLPVADWRLSSACHTFRAVSINSRSSSLFSGLLSLKKNPLCPVREQWSITKLVAQVCPIT